MEAIEEMASNMVSKVLGRKYNFVIFGASGFTGQFVVEELARVTSAGEKHGHWAVAGRNEEKLRQCLQDATKNTGIKLDHIPIIIADVSDSASLVHMAKETKVILNCVGPYRFYGESVVKAAIEGGAHHLDISGEPNYLEGMQLKYDKAAKEVGVYVIGACGWDSIPCDMGIQFARDQFDGILNSVEMVMKVKSGPQGQKVHFATFHSMIHGVANRNELKPLRKELYDKPIPRSSYKLKPRGVLFYHEGVHGWCLPFLGADKPVAQRTQYFNYHTHNWKPIQVQTYMKFGSIFSALGMLLWGIFFGIMTSFASGRRLLEKYPNIFSLGLFSHEGPTREQLKEIRFTEYIFGQGWLGKKDMKPEEEPNERPMDKIVCKVEGPDPGYGATSTFLVASALTVLEDHSALPPGGGVLTPGSAFAKTKLISRLEERGITFQKAT